MFPFVTLLPKLNTLADAVQASGTTIGVGVGVGVGVGAGTASPYNQCLAEALPIDVSLMVTAVVPVAQTEMEKSFCMLGRFQSSSTVTRVLLPAATAIPLNVVIPSSQTRV